MWAVGCIIYSLLSGYMFGDKKKLPLVKWRFRKFFASRLSDIKYRSAGAQKFIKSLMKYNSKKRLSPTDALIHPWMIQRLFFDRHRSREEERHPFVNKRLTQ